MSIDPVPAAAAVLRAVMEADDAHARTLLAGFESRHLARLHRDAGTLSRLAGAALADRDRADHA